MFKDARSVSWYPCNQWHILQYVRYSKWINIEKGIAKLYVNNDFWTKIKTQKQQNKQANIYIFAKRGNGTQDPSHPSLVFYLLATETTERVD